jgi:hypothetical protein
MPVFQLTMDSGFFCVVFHVCTMYLEHGSSLVLNCSRWNYGSWNDFFRSLSERNVSEVPWGTPPQTIRNIPLNVQKWTLGDYRRALRELLRPSALLRYEVRHIKEQIGRPYTALFVRRGDKIVSGEAAFLPMSEILSHVTYNDDTVFFIQTDDYTVVEETRALLPNHTIHCTVPPTKRGSYHNHKYNQNVYVPWTEKAPIDARAETLEMLTGLFVCLEAEHCWSDDTSNVGRFLKLYDDSVHIYPSDYSVDESLHAHPAWNIHE